MNGNKFSSGMFPCDHINMFSFGLDIEDLVVRVVIVGVILTFRSLTQEALEMVCGLLVENHRNLVCQTSQAVLIFPDFLGRESKISKKALSDPAKKIEREARQNETNKVMEDDLAFSPPTVVIVVVVVLTRFSQSTCLRETFSSPVQTSAGES